MSIPTDLSGLFAPLEAARPEGWVVGQLGQSLDGRIATATGHSHYINGPDDIRRLHRLRALADAVVVGAGTAIADDPRLTVRHVDGDNPVRVILDPKGRVPGDRKVFTDGAAETLHLVASGVDPDAAAGADAGPERIQVDTVDGRFAPKAVIALLRERGLSRILIEGGGLTVSAFLQAGVLDRLHLSVASLIIGSGRPSITLPEISTLETAIRPEVHHYRVGTDLVFDVVLKP